MISRLGIKPRKVPDGTLRCVFEGVGTVVDQLWEPAAVGVITPRSHLSPFSWCKVCGIFKIKTPRGVHPAPVWPYLKGQCPYKKR